MGNNISEVYSGIITVKPQQNSSLQDFCVSHIGGYNPARFQPFAVRVFSAKELIVTVYARDLSAKDDGSDNIPVRKFKLEHLILTDLLSFLSEFNFTLSTGTEYIGDMRVINN